MKVGASMKKAMIMITVMVGIVIVWVMSHITEGIEPHIKHSSDFKHTHPINDASESVFQLDDITLSDITAFESAVIESQEVTDKEISDSEMNLELAIKNSEEPVLDFESQISTRPANAQPPTSRGTPHFNSRFDHLAISVVTNRTNMGRADIQYKTFLNQVQNVLHSSTHRTYANGVDEPKTLILTPHQRLSGLMDLRILFPHAEWFIQIDADVYLFVENLNMKLKQYSPEKPIYLGSENQLKYNGDAKPGPVHGGSMAGFAVSRAAIELLNHDTISKCVEKYKDCSSDDTLTALCFKEVGAEFISEPDFHFRPIEAIAWPSDGCKAPLTFSQISPTLMQRLFTTQMVSEATVDGTGIVHDHFMTYSDVFSHIHRDIGIYTKGIVGVDFRGGDYNHMGSRTGSNCLNYCKADPQCLAWSFDSKGEVCWLKSSIEARVFKVGIVSGVIPGRYKCLERETVDA